MRELPERSAEDTYEVAVLADTPRAGRVSETQRLLEAVREECGRKRETRVSADASDAMVELRRTHAERRKKLAECAEALAARDQEIDRARKEQQEEEKKKAAASEEFFMRWLNDAEDQLRNVREELSQEQALSTRLQEELNRESSAHAEALARRDADVAAEEAEAERQRAGAEEALRKLADTERDLEAARVEFVDERSLVAKAMATEAAEAGRQRAGAEDAFRKLANAERDLEAARGDFEVERNLAARTLAHRDAELAAKVAEAGRQRTEAEAALQRLADTEHNLQAVRAELGEERRLVAQAKADSERTSRAEAEAALGRLSNAEHGLQATRAELGEERRLVAQAKADSERTLAELNQFRARELSRLAAERSAELERHSAVSEAERRRAEAEEQWQRRLADADEALRAVQDELVREQRLAARVEASGERAFTEICQSHADEISRRAVEHSEVLARWKQEAMDAQRGQEEAERRVAEADLHWRRSLAEADCGLQAAKEELRRERQLAATAQDSGESTLAELRQALAGERVRSASARAEAEALAFERDASAEAERARREAQSTREAAQASEVLERAAQAQRAERARLAAEETWQRRLDDVEAMSFRSAQEAEEAKHRATSAEQSASRAEEALYLARTELEQERRLLVEEQRRNRILGEGAKSLQRRDEELDIVRREAGIANANAIGLRREAEEARRSCEAAERQGAEVERHWQGRLARAGEELRSAREELQAARAAPAVPPSSLAPAAEAAGEQDLRQARIDRDHLSRKLVDCTKALAQREAELEQLRRDAKLERQQVSMQRAEADESWLRRLAAAESRGADEGRAEGRRAAAVLRQAHADELAHSASFGMEAERHMELVEEQWQRRLSILEEDLEAAREELRHERGLVSQAQADGERAVLRTIQGFWQARVEAKEASPSSVPASASPCTAVTARFCMETPRPEVLELPIFGTEGWARGF